MHVFLLAFTLATPTGGAGPAQSAKPQQHYQAAAKHIDIDDDEVVEGANKNPEGEDIFARKRSRFGTLIKLRENFRRELLKSDE
jgi:hypothetical protein